MRRACRLLELNETRAWQWLARRERDELDDRSSGGSPVHGLLEHEAEQIVALFWASPTGTDTVRSGGTGQVMGSFAGVWSEHL